MDPDPQLPNMVLANASVYLGDIADFISPTIAFVQAGDIQSTPSLFLWFTLGIFLLLSAFFSGSETAIFSITKIHLAQIEKNKNRSFAAIKKLLDDPRTTLTTILIFNMFINVAAALTGGALAESYLPVSSVLSFLAGAIGVTVLILLIGEITPKTLAIEKTEKFATLVSPIILFLTRLARPFERTLKIFTDFLFRLLHIKSDEDKNIISEAELKTLLTMGEAEELLEEDEKEMINGVFEFGEKTVEEIITPRIDMECFSDSLSQTEMLEAVKKAAHKRLPIYDKSMDNIIGILHSKDFLLNKDVDYRKLMRKPLLVPPKKKLPELMTEFKRKRSHIALVVDEFGGIAGLVSLNDLLEEIVGEIREQGQEVTNKVIRVSASEWLIPGKAEIEYINEKLELNLSLDMGRTLSGFIMNTAGKVLSVGDEIETSGVYLRVERVEKTVVSLARLRKVDF